jgi:nitrogenase molybdenum-iron protein alpha/beta subunit
MNLEHYAPSSNFPYLMGVYLAVNALPDAYLFVDGPDCSFYKAQFIHGKHDLNSSLISSDGDHRVRMSDVTVNQIVTDRTPALKRALLSMSESPNCALALLTSMPMATITGTQYDLLVRDLSPKLKCPLLEVPSLSLSGDWLDGYAQTLSALAAGVALSGTPDPGKVAVVGYLMDRNERDHGANVDEMERLLRALGVEPVSIWLSGRPLSHLSRAGEAGTIISLPHGREAARILAARTGAAVLETGLPVGLKGTIDWLSGIAVPLGREQAGETLLDSELRRVVPGLQWLVPRHFQGRRVLVVADPYLLEGLVDFLQELGCLVAGLVAVGREEHLTPVPPSLQGIELSFEANPYEMEGLLAAGLNGEGLDLAIQSETFGWRGPGDYAVVPFGLASASWHAIFDAPYLGFSGALSLADRLANHLMARYR